MRPALEKTVEHAAVNETVIGDKGYDSEANRRYIVIELGAAVPRLVGAVPRDVTLVRMAILLATFARARLSMNFDFRSLAPTTYRRSGVGCQAYGLIFR